MVYQVVLNEHGRIAAASADSNLGPAAIMIDLPEDFIMETLHEYVITDGKLEHDPLPAPEPEPPEVTTAELAARVDALARENQALADAVDAMLGVTAGEDKLEAAERFAMRIENAERAADLATGEKVRG